LGNGGTGEEPRPTRSLSGSFDFNSAAETVDPCSEINSAAKGKNLLEAIGMGRF
jgi:hypothetical protein